MDRWAIELEEHEIEYKLRSAIKAQVLVDFLAETQEEEEETEYQSQRDKTKNAGWRLYTDGASSDDGSGAGLRIAKEMNIEEITVLVDSQLVANHGMRRSHPKLRCMSDSLFGLQATKARHDFSHRNMAIHTIGHRHSRSITRSSEESEISASNN
ncbi:hypothetical protein Tco_0530265 [Tanacetum coccineum]